LFHPFDEIRNSAGIPFHDNLDSGIWTIAHVANQAQTISDMLDEVTESDTLNSSMYDDVLCDDDHGVRLPSLKVLQRVTHSSSCPQGLKAVSNNKFPISNFFTKFMRFQSGMA
jgi:hypothetical protein